MTTPTLTSTDPYRGHIVQTGENTFKAAPVIIKSVNAAKAIYLKLRTDHLRRIALYTEIEGLLSGSPPYNPAELRAAGLQHIANFNDMSALAVIERASLAYWNLLNDSQYVIRFVLRLNDPQQVDWAETMAQHWDTVIRKRWKSFTINVNNLTTQLVKFGLSPALFPDERDPAWRVVEVSKFYVPNQTQSDLDMITCVCVETEFTVQYLWQTYLAYKDKVKPSQQYPYYTLEEPAADGEQTDCPWNLWELGNLLVKVGSNPLKDTIQPQDWFDLERKLYSGDISFDRMYNDTLKIVSIFQKEYAGKISHGMFHRDYSEGRFLFFQPDQYENMNEALVIFTLNPGAQTIHSNRGYGHKIYSLAQAKIMQDNSIVDLGRWASTPILKSSSLNTKDVDQIRFYPGVPTNIGTAEFVQNNLGANITEVIGISQYLQSQIQTNISYSGADPSQPDPDLGSLSPAQTRIAAFKEFSVLKNNIRHFLNTFSWVLQNMTIKMLHSKKSYPNYEWAEEWKTRCVEDGVPPEIFSMKGVKDNELPPRMECYASQPVGAGSQVAHLIGLQELQAIAGSFGPDEEREYKRQYITATVGPESLPAFLGKPQNAPDNQASLAGVENAIMLNGQSPVFSPDNDHRAHLGTHLAVAEQVRQGIDSGQMDVIQGEKILNTAVPHLNEHFQALEQNPFAKNFIDHVKPVVGQINQYAGLIRGNAEKAAQDQQQQMADQAQKQQQVMTDEQLKEVQVQGDESRAERKLQHSMAIQDAGSAAKQEALAKSTDAKVDAIASETHAKVQSTYAQKGLSHVVTQPGRVRTETPAAIAKEIGTRNGTSKPPETGLP